MSRTLDTSLYSAPSQALLAALTKTVVGQEKAGRVLVDIVERFQAGLADPSRPAGNALFLGPTGVGKTYTIEQMCKALFGDQILLSASPSL